MTFYVTDINDPWNSLATLPGFTIEEAAEVVQHDYSYENCVPMTGEERKKFVKKCDSAPGGDYEEVYESMKDSFMYTQFLDGDIDSKISYSFWITSAYDSHTTMFAVGADTVGNYDFNLNRIAKKLGEKYFYEYAVGKGKRIKDYSTLVKTLSELGVTDVNITKEDLIDSCNKDEYFVFRK